MSVIVISSTEKKLLDLMPGFDRVANKLVSHLRWQQARSFGDDRSDIPLPLVSVTSPDGSTSIEQLESLRESRILRWSPESVTFEVSDPNDPNEYLLLTDDNDLMSVLVDHEDVTVPEEIRSMLVEHLDSMQLSPKAESRILNRLIVLHSPSPAEKVVLQFSKSEDHVAQLEGALAASAEDAIVFKAESGEELHVYPQEANEIWPAVLRMGTRPQAEAKNVIVKMDDEVLTLVEEFNRFGIGKVRKDRLIN